MKKNNDSSIIDKIQKIRESNNKCWMDILRLAFSSRPEEARKIFSEITKNDAEINKLSKSLASNV